MVVLIVYMLKIKTMIVNFIGQPNSGKTTLAKQLQIYIETILHKKCDVLDGDDLRELYNNKDYSIIGRKKNIEIAQIISKLLDKRNDFVLTSFVSPFKSLREELKADSNYKVNEIYLYSDRIREGKMVSYYEPPTENYLGINTDKNNINQSLQLIIQYLNSGS